MDKLNPYQQLLLSLTNFLLYLLLEIGHKIQLCYVGDIPFVTLKALYPLALIVSYKFRLYFHFKSVGGSWSNYCFHFNAHTLVVTDNIRYYYPRYYLEPNYFFKYSVTVVRCIFNILAISLFNIPFSFSFLALLINFCFSSL